MQIERIREIICSEGLYGLWRGIKRYFFWHPLSDILDDILVILGRRLVTVDLFDFKLILDLKDKGICRDLWWNKIREKEATNIYQELRGK